MMCLENMKKKKKERGGGEENYKRNDMFYGFGTLHFIFLLPVLV